MHFIKSIQTLNIKKNPQSKYSAMRSLHCASSLPYCLSDHIIKTFIYLSFPRLKCQWMQIKHHLKSLQCSTIREAVVHLTERSWMERTPRGAEQDKSHPDVELCLCVERHSSSGLLGHQCEELTPYLTQQSVSSSTQTLKVLQVSKS